MGLTISAVFTRLFSKKSVRILMLGLDAAGKTTILYKLKLGKTLVTIPTIGFNVETVEYKNISFTVWDITGQPKVRELCKRYFEQADGIIFVIDSNDRDRIEEVRLEFHSMLEDPGLRKSIKLIFANKQDLPNCMSTTEITDKLGLNTLEIDNWYVQAASATQGNGLYEGLDWLSNELGKVTK